MQFVETLKATYEEKITTLQKERGNKHLRKEIAENGESFLLSYSKFKVMTKLIKESKSLNALLVEVNIDEQKGAELTAELENELLFYLEVMMGYWQHYAMEINNKAVFFTEPKKSKINTESFFVNQAENKMEPEFRNFFKSYFSVFKFEFLHGLLSREMKAKATSFLAAKDKLMNFINGNQEFDISNKGLEDVLFTHSMKAKYKGTSFLFKVTDDFEAITFYSEKNKAFPERTVKIDSDALNQYLKTLSSAKQQVIV